MHYDIDVVFVTYRPDLALFEKSLDSICGQVRKVYIIDNSADPASAAYLHGLARQRAQVELLVLQQNAGIARAQNIGLQKTLDAHAGLTLLSDQDTIYPADYIARMLANYAALGERPRVAAIAPDFSEENKASGESEGFFQLDGVSSVKLAASQPFDDVAQVIASGMLVNNAALAEVGMMDEALFIDWVDFEWCWRARSRGYRIIGCHNVVIRHTLGDGALKVGAKTYSLHTPLRHYYIVRNGVAIALTKKYLTGRMRLGIFVKSLRYVAAFTLFGDAHVKNAMYCCKGFYHGLTGRLGPFEK